MASPSLRSERGPPPLRVAPHAARAAAPNTAKGSQSSASSSRAGSLFIFGNESAASEPPNTKVSSTSPRPEGRRDSRFEQPSPRGQPSKGQAGSSLPEETIDGLKRPDFHVPARAAEETQDSECSDAESITDSYLYWRDLPREAPTAEPPSSAWGNGSGRLPPPRTSGTSEQEPVPQRRPRVSPRASGRSVGREADEQDPVPRPRQAARASAAAGERSASGPAGERSTAESQHRAKTRASVAELLRSRPRQEQRRPSGADIQDQRRPSGVDMQDQRRHSGDYAAPEWMPADELIAHMDRSAVTEPDAEPVDTDDAEAGIHSNREDSAPSVGSSAAPGAMAGTGYDPSPPLSGWAVRALDEAQGLAARRCFADAIRACIPVLQGPQRAINLLSGLCSSWDKADHEREQKHMDEVEELANKLEVAQEATDALRGVDTEKDAELDMERQKRESAERRVLKQKEDNRALVSELTAARERCEAWRKLKEEKDMEVQTERRKREDAERQAQFLRRRSEMTDRALRENQELKQRLRDAEERQATAAAVPSRDEVVRQLAELECGPLRGASSEERGNVKKRLLVKWHPDKQPSADHVPLATQVMQELQNRPEWKS